jgi:SWI/SNF chromatin-remodeling complex subunit SWI1
MSTWMNDGVPNHNGNGFPHMTDPNAVAAGAMMDPNAFMANQGQFNPAQFAQNQQNPQSHPQHQPQHQQMQGMQNGPMRNASPSFQNPVYQTNQVIPSKRPRPREDGIAGSPRQNPGMLPTSRAETPQQQGFQGFQQGGMPQQNQGQFPHIPNGSATASPSPIMGNQMRPGSVPQRVATASPHPFSPGGQQQFGAQGSPVPSEHGTPQPNPYIQNMPPGFNPNFAQSPSNPSPSPRQNPMAGPQMMPQQMGQMAQMPQHMGQMPNHMFAQMQQQQQQQQQHQMQQAQHPQTPQGQPQRPPSVSEQQKMAAYQMRLQQQLQGNMQMQAQMQAQQMGRGMMSKQQAAGVPNGQMPQQGAARPQQRPGQGLGPETFTKNLVALMTSKGLPLEQNPMIGDRPVNLMMLFQSVQSRGGYKPVTGANGWAHIAQSIGLPVQSPAVPQALKAIYERNLHAFEEAWHASQKQRMQQAGNAANNQGTPQKPMQPSQQPQQVNQGQMQPNQQPHAQPQTPVKASQTPVNGYSTPQPGQPQHANAAQGHSRNSMSRGAESNSEFASMPSPASNKAGGLPMGQADPRASGQLAPRGPMERLSEQPDEYGPCARELTTWGGLDIHAASMFGLELERWRPDVPLVQEMGHIDVGAITRSLQSGIIGEVRLALDTLGAVSMAPTPMHSLQLKFCDDLVDALVDCAEDQLDILAEATVEVSDEIQLTSYEDVVRACKIEQWTVKETPVFGSTDYNLDRAVDRLVAVSTILRNLSFGGEQSENCMILADECVIKLLCTMVRYLGTRTMLLRTHANTLDFMKDAIILLSNVAGFVEITTKEQALCLLHFLLSFAPTASSASTQDGDKTFAPYEPSLHPYLSHAVDSLAKLLARDEPNRTHYKALFGGESSNSSSNELLTSTFAMAIAPVPDRSRELARSYTLPGLVEARKPFLMQGLLSAEIVVSIAPGSESGLVKSWLRVSGIGQNLQRLVRDLSRLYEQQQAAPSQANRRQPPPRKDPELVYLVVLGASLLKRLAEKAVDYNDPSLGAYADILPPADLLMEALSMPSPEWTKEGYIHHLSALFNISSQ